MKLSVFLSQVLTVAICANPAVSAARSADRPLSKDFKIVATFGSGSVIAHKGDVIGWKLVLTADGAASQEAYVIPDHTRRKTIRVSEKALAEIARHVREANFFDLPGRLEEDAYASDVPVYVLEITMDGRSHRVRVYGPPFSKRDAALRRSVRRFVEIWASLVQTIPSPNNNSELNYLRGSI